MFRKYNQFQFVLMQLMGSLDLHYQLWQCLHHHHNLIQAIFLMQNLLHSSIRIILHMVCNLMKVADHTLQKVNIRITCRVCGLMEGQLNQRVSLLFKKVYSLLLKNSIYVCSCCSFSMTLISWSYYYSITMSLNSDSLFICYGI